MFRLLSEYKIILKCLDCRIVVSRSHQGDVMKMAEKFKPPGVVTPAGGAGFKVIIISKTLGRKCSENILDNLKSNLGILNRLNHFLFTLVCNRRKTKTELFMLIFLPGYF